MTSGSVNGAGLVGDLILAHPLEGVEGLSTVAAVVTGARDKNLWGDVDIGPSSLSGDLDSVREGGGGGMSPARSAVLWDVLVSNIGQVVDIINIVPNESLWDIVNWLKWLLDEINLWLSIRFSARGRWVDELQVLGSVGFLGGDTNKGEISGVFH